MKTTKEVAEDLRALRATKKKTRTKGKSASTKARRRRTILRSMKHMTKKEQVAAQARLTVLDVTPRETNAILDQQGFRCPICGRPDGVGTMEDKRLALDHCHRTDRVRGMLCDTCNLGLGAFKDSLGLLRNAQQYLLDH